MAGVRSGCGVVIAVGLVLAGCGGGTGSPSLAGVVRTVPGPAPGVSPPVRVGTGPTAVAVGAGGVWVANNSDGTLTRLDPRTGRVTGRPIGVGPGPLAVAVGAGTVWVATGDGRVVRVDPRTQQVKRGDAPVPGVSGLAVGSGAVWATSATDGALRSIDPRTGELRGAPIRIGGAPGDVAVGGGAVWVAETGGGEVARVDPGTRRVVARTRVAPAQPRGQVLALTYGEGGVWVVESPARLGQPVDLVRLDPATGDVSGAPLRISGRVGTRIAAGAGSVWVTDAGNVLPPAPRRAPGVLRVDPRRRALQGARIPAGTGPQGIAVGAGSVWVTEPDANRVVRVEP